MYIRKLFKMIRMLKIAIPYFTITFYLKVMNIFFKMTLIFISFNHMVSLINIPSKKKRLVELDVHNGSAEMHSYFLHMYFHIIF